MGLSKKRKYWVLLCLFFSLLANTSHAKDQESEGQGKTFYKDRKRGYYWYEVKPVPEKKEKDVEGGAKAKKRKEPTTKTYDELWKMHPEDFQKYVTDVQNYAIQNPTVENVERYYYVNMVANKKASAFASVAELVGQMNPDLSTDQTNPITAPGRMAMVKMKEEDKDRTIYNARDNFGLIMFTQKGCGFCESQDGILNFFKRRYRWNVKTVDIGENPGIGARFGIETTPTLLLIKKGDNENYLNVAVGVVSMDDLVQRLVRSIKYLNGEIKPEQMHMWEYERNTPADPLAPIEIRKKQ